MQKILKPIQAMHQNAQESEYFHHNEYINGYFVFQKWKNICFLEFDDIVLILLQ